MDVTVSVWMLLALPVCAIIGWEFGRWLGNKQFRRKP